MENNIRNIEYNNENNTGNTGNNTEYNTGITEASAMKLLSCLSEAEQATEIRVFESIDSTNTYSKLHVKELMEAPNEHALVLAFEQTAGRGRQGKTFSSKRNNGIYMTLTMGVHRRMEDFLFITSACAVAVVRVLNHLIDEVAERNGKVPPCYEQEESRPKIKWVNDIWQGDKKVCGILTEAVNDYAKGTIEYAVIGIGLNIGTDLDVLPEDVKMIAGSIDLNLGDRERIAAMVTEEVFAVAEELRADSSAASRLIEEYRQESMIIGRDITWSSSGQQYEGRAIDINDEGNLIVETEGGIMKLNSGLVSVRPKRDIQ